jgi:ferric-dicitrate binding protein FerR (iron transport regulator)
MSAREREARVETEIAAPLREACPALDELGRARLASAIEAALDREDASAATHRAPGDRQRWRAWTAAVGIAVAAGLGAVVLTRGPGTAPRRSDVQIARAPGTSLSSLDRGAGVGAPVPALGPSTSLLARAGERARATIGARVRVTLVGPGRVSVLPAARPGDVELALESGRLLVDYDGHAGGTLRVRSPGAVTTVVGTLFAVEATGSSSRVAVARGRVRTEEVGGQLQEVAAGSSWTSADGRLAAISDELAAALVRHEGDWTPVPPDRRAAAPSEPARPIDRPPAPAEPGPEAARVSQPVDLESLYAEAEAAMRARAVARARRTLKTIVDRDRNGPLGEAALIDLARLALAGGDREEARRALARLPSPVSDPALAETAAHLRCRVALPKRGASDRDGGDPCVSGASATADTR